MKQNRKIFMIFSPLVLISLCLLSTPAEGGMNDYCITPPFIAQNIPPNVLIVLDNSLSMCDQAYAGSYNPGAFANGQYYGYFDGSKNYQYSGSGRWEETAAAMNTGTVASPIANGSFLNWAMMRRVEVAKKLLIGGKGNPRSWNGAVTVKLDGESACGGGWDFEKDFDTSAGNLIYPFVGNYRFARSSDTLDVTPLASGADTFDTYPNGDISVPAGWSEFPVSGAMVAYTKVDETPSDGDTTYIQNSNTTSPVIMDYNYIQSKPAGVITVTVKVRAKQTASGSTRKIRGVLRIGGVNYESNTSSLSTSYSLYSFTWATNPATGAPWAWTDIKAAGLGSLEGFGVKADAAYTTKYPRITQVYLNVSVAIPTGGPYKVIVDQGNKDATGIIDDLSNEVRFGLAYYAGSNEGAKIDTLVDFGAKTSMITSVMNLTPSTYTPLGETLYEMTRYFRQDAPYYSNSPADYATGLNYDPFYFNYADASIADRYVPCVKSFILFLTDGESTYDTTMPGTATASPYSACTLTNIKACSGFLGSPNNPNPRFAGTTIGTTYSLSGTDYLIDVAYWARTKDMRPGVCTSVPTTFQQCIPGTQNISLYTVYMFGKGSTLLKDAAIYGGFNDLSGNNKPDCTTMPAECYKDSNGDGVVSSDGTDDPLTYYEGEDGYALQASINNAISDILRRVTSGTAASVLASGEGSGANLIQAVFYPRMKFSNASSFDEISWIGRLTNLWYYVDPLFSTSNIREDDGDSILNLKTDVSHKDYIVSLYYDKSNQKAKVKRWRDPAGNGVTGAAVLPDIEFEQIGRLWEAGTMLWKRDVATAGGKRKLYTTVNGTGFLAGNFSADTLNGDTNNATALRPYLQAATDAEAANIINWVQGVDISGYRSRTVKVESIDTTARVWKLGDVVNSTPKISSWMALNTYNKVYQDSTYGPPNADARLSDPVDNNHFLTTAAYKARGMVYTGGNDGMLHAFKLGTLQLRWSGQGSTQMAKLVNPDTGSECSPTDANPCGKEAWAFIPKNVLPYLKYLADPGYCHLYSVDLTPFVFDASIDGAADDARTASSWKTVVIGGMRFGGACKNSTETCTTADCVKTPIAGVGYSSYFALDVTDQNNPKLLWEFSDESLGFATTGPSVVRINGQTGGLSDSSKNGHWFVVLGSGPTGPISTSDHQFMGESDQSMKLFILDLKTGNLLRTMDSEISIADAFVGSLVNASLDADVRDYQDEVVYVPFIKKCTATTAAPSPFSATNICENGTWTNGGVGRLSTKRDPDPNNWAWSIVIDNTGPVTSAATKLVDLDKNNLWVYFGTGRYYFAQAVMDDADGKRFLFGIKDPCFSSSGYNLTCTTSATSAGSPFNGLTDVTDVANVPTTVTADASSFKGWYLGIDPTGTYTYLPDAATSYKAERVITDPLASQGKGILFFTSYKPTADQCSSGGKSFIWAVQYNTGGAPISTLKGKALIQVSTGAIEQKDLATAFTEAGGRKSAAMEGKPPEAQGLSVLSQPKAAKRIIQLRER